MSVEIRSKLAVSKSLKSGLKFPKYVAYILGVLIGIIAIYALITDQFPEDGWKLILSAMGLAIFGALLQVFRNWLSPQK